MSVVTIQVGQCGNQVGQAFFQQTLEELKRSSPLIRERAVETYFQRRQDCLVPNAVLVDMEPKVIQRCTKSQYKTADNYVKWRYDPHMTVYRQGGSGNNWALGHQYYSDEAIYG